MATNPKMLEDWGVTPEAPARAYLQSNSYLRSVLPTTPSRNFREPVAEEGEFMGVRFTWHRVDGAEFPQPIVDAFTQLADFAALHQNWDSYGGSALKQSAVPTVISLIFAGHRQCMVPKLHPLSKGGVALTWRRGGRELEVQVAGDGSLDALFEDTAKGEDIELPRKSSLDDVRPLLAKFFG